MRANLEDNLARKLRLSSANFSTLEAAISSAYRISPDGPQFFYLNPGIATIDVFMPPITKNGGQFYLITNTSSSGGSLNIRDSGGVLLRNATNGTTNIIISSNLSWHITTLSTITGSIPGGAFFVFNDPVNGLIARPIVSSDIPAAMNTAIGGVKAVPFVTGKVLGSLDEGGAFVTVSSREVLLANRTYFVDAARPDDSGDGLTSGTAWKTMQKAIDVVASIDLSAFAVTINVAAGTYTQALALKSYIGAGPVVFLGATLPTTIMSATSASCVTANGVIGRWLFDNFRFTNSGSGSSPCVFVQRASQVDFQLGVEFGPSLGPHINLTNTALVNITCPVTINGNASQHVAAAANCTFACAGRAISLASGLTFSSAFLQATQGGIITYNGNTFPGPGGITATGPSASVLSNAVIDTVQGTNTAAANYLPGNHTFTEASGGVLI